MVWWFAIPIRMKEDLLPVDNLSAEERSRSVELSTLVNVVARSLTNMLPPSPENSCR